MLSHSWIMRYWINLKREAPQNQYPPMNSEISPFSLTIFLSFSSTYYFLTIHFFFFFFLLLLLLLLWIWIKRIKFREVLKSIVFRRNSTTMATQALVSSSLTSSVETARHITGARNGVPSLRKNSFVVRASATPPVKVCYPHSFCSHSLNYLHFFCASIKNILRFYVCQWHWCLMTLMLDHIDV